jgi:hypothetical protein
MCCFDEELWAKLPETQKGKVMQEYDELMQAIGKGGHLRASVKLEPSSTSATVRENNGRPVITDGPFAETKEQLGGYYEVECQNLDQAIEAASRIPSVGTGSIEVRPIMEFDTAHK